MIITWTPIRSSYKPEYSQPEPDVLSVMGAELDFTNPRIVEYDIPEAYRDYVQKARREEDGNLHVWLLAHYQQGNALHDEKVTNNDIGEVTWT